MASSKRPKIKFETVEELESDFVYDDFTSANVSKYLVKESRQTVTIALLEQRSPGQARG